MSKRVAGYQLTADNFDQEEEVDEKAHTGEFAKAPEDVISKRVIKKAKRRNNDTEASSGSFKGFAGFGTGASLFGKSPAFSSTNDLASETSKTTASVAPSFAASLFAKTNGTLSNTSLSSSENFKSNTGPASFQIQNPTENSNSVSSVDLAKNISSDKVNNSTNGKKTIRFSLGNSPSKKSSVVEDRDQIFIEQITELNNSVLSWIKQHIDENPLIDLTPVFTDYKNYMDEIERKYCKPDTSSAVSSENSGKAKTSSIANISPVAVRGTEQKPLTLSSTPVFGNTLESKTTGLSTKTPVAQFFSKVPTSTPAATSDNVAGTEDSNKNTGNEDNDNEVPKVERKTVIEADAFHTIRCKLFFKKGQEWKELGIGMLYLKPLNNKTQLLVRMETSGGNIMLNICLNPSLPCSRVGKNNVSIASVPNPPVFLKPNDGDNDKPVTYLIRVKGTLEADELCKVINDKKVKE